MEGPNKLWGGEENISKLMNERGTFIRNLKIPGLQLMVCHDCFSWIHISVVSLWEAIHGC